MLRVPFQCQSTRICVQPIALNGLSAALDRFGHLHHLICFDVVQLLHDSAGPHDQDVGCDGLCWMTNSKISSALQAIAFCNRALNALGN